MGAIIESLLGKIKNRQLVGFQEAKELAEKTETAELLKAANHIKVSRHLLFSGSFCRM